ncbi:DNA integration/recombination/invertion protein [Moritella viscosa]|uniref:DNA integration/recombination/invertion protein n=1 Tax=Moritella viscosa TaxID=80854 RepID=A0A1L0E4E8_9GAMM|nr:DNA integration/recombination/invertion protein [Moritella viscosa]SHO08289.1 DNA integration/recombination/invertion protein [Moritella viscosa]
MNPIAGMQAGFELRKGKMNHVLQHTFTSYFMEVLPKEFSRRG